MVHDLTNSELLIVQPTSINASLECLGKQPVSVSIPASAIITLSTDCSIHARRYRIERISFAKFEWTKQTEIDFNVQSGEHVKAFKPVSQEQLFVLTNDSARQLALAEELNNSTATQLQEFSAARQFRWMNLSINEQTGLEQLLAWTLLGLNLLLTLLLAVCIVKIKCRQDANAKTNATPNIRISSVSGLEEGSLDPVWKELRELKRRLLGVEDEFLLQLQALNPCTEIANITHGISPRIKPVDEDNVD